jgi:predicted nucleic acid-binding protein
MTSCLDVGEVLAGASSVEKRTVLENSVRSLGFRLLPLSDECIAAFGKLRSQNVSVADSIHLSCAAAAGTDLFLTEDRALHRRHIEGVKFIAGMRSAFPQ